MLTNDQTIQWYAVQQIIITLTFPVCTSVCRLPAVAQDGYKEYGYEEQYQWSNDNNQKKPGTCINKNAYTCGTSKHFQEHSTKFALPTYARKPHVLNVKFYNRDGEEKCVLKLKVHV